jgi:hypothetical protein
MPEHETQNILGGVQRRQVNPDHRLHLDNAGSDFDEPQAQRVELRDAPHLTLWHRHAQAPHEPVGAGMQEQPELVGRGLAAGGAVGRQMHLLGLDVVFHVAASGADPLDATPTGGRVEELLEAARLAFLRRGLEARLRAGLDIPEMPAHGAPSTPP